MELQIESYNYNGHSSSVLFMNPVWFWFNEKTANAKSVRLPYINERKRKPTINPTTNPLKLYS